MAQNMGVELWKAEKVPENLVALTRQGRLHQDCQNPVFADRSSIGVDLLGHGGCRLSA
jgi:hypothetical protein